MKQFLRETWQLWYWAHYCPSKLQQRMNEWAPREEEDGHRAETRYVDIFLYRVNRRLLAQFFLLLLIFSFPLILMIAFSGQPLGWWLVVAISLIAYGLGLWSFLPLALHLPLLFMLLYLGNAPLLYETLTSFPPLSHTLQATLMGGLALITTSWIVYRLWLAKWIKLGHLVLVVGNALSYAGAIWFASQSNVLTILTMLLVGGSVYFLVIDQPRNIKDSKATTVAVVEAVTRAFALAVAFAVAVIGVFAFAKAVSFAIIIVIALPLALLGAGAEVLVRVITFAIVVAVGGVFAVARRKAIVTAIVFILILIFAFDAFDDFANALAFDRVVAVLGFLPLPLLWLAGWVIGRAFAIKQQHRWGGGVALVLAYFAIEQQGPVGVFVIPPTLIGYYRLLDYFVLSFISLSCTMQLDYKSSNLLFRLLREIIQTNNEIPTEHLRYWLHTLPPHTHELLWFRLPGHAHILATTFKKDTQTALETLQQMRTSSYPGLPRAVQRALPQIVSDQFLAPTSIDDLISTATPEHPILPFLVPSLYQPEEKELSTETLPQLTASTLIDTKTATMLSRLQRIARDVKAVLEAGNAFLREQGLQGTVNQINFLQEQMPGMGLDESAITRWRAVLEHWQSLIQHELELQQAASQGEVVNPFQSGNPLRIERKHLFKGRQQFADDILRQVLNRSRPTLVLHGPRRCGKSSFLQNLSRFLPSDMIPVYLDLQDGALISSEGDFCYGLVRAMGRDMRSQGLNPPAANRHEFRASPYAALEDWLDEAEEALEERRILLCLDEFEELGNTIRQGIISEKLLKHLRHLIQHRDELSFLFCGVQTLDEMGPNWSSYFISVEPVEMLYLEPKEAKELLEDPEPEFNLGYGRGIVDEVLKITRCQPYLVQLIGEAMVKQANQHQTRLITPPLLEAALEGALTAGQPYFTNLWDEYTGAFDKPDQVAAGRRFLHALAHDLPRTLPDDEMATRDAIRRMERYHLIEQDEQGTYRFEVPFVERWVRERALLESDSARFA